MRAFKVFIVFVLITFVERCTPAKLPKTGTDPHPIKHTNTGQIKQLSDKTSTQKKTKDSSKTSDNKASWTARSVIVQPHDMDGVVRSQSATSPTLDKLYEQRYHAMEKVTLINNQINSILQRNTQENNYADAVSSFVNPGSFKVQGAGSMILGAANAGSVAGVENAEVRQLAVNMSHDYSSSAPLDIPLPLNDPEDVSQKPLKENATAKLADDYDQEIGDPKKFDSVCSVLKLTFEHTSGAMVLDDSPEINNAELEDGAYITNTDSKSGISASIGHDGYLQLPNTFKGMPKKAAAISMWIKLSDVKGVNPLFQAEDRNSTVHYDLSIVDGKPLWVHRNDTDQEMFKVTANDDAHFTAGAWHHIVGAYSTKYKEATLWLDGKQIGSQKNVTGMLSQDWSKVYMFEGKTSGLADNIFMFRCPLDRTKIIALYVSVASPKDSKRFKIPTP